MEDQESEVEVTDTYATKLHRMRNTISHSRRLELMTLANAITAHVLETTKPHERCLLRRMVELLMPGED